MATVTLIKPSQRNVNTAQTSGMVREAAVAPDTCGSSGLWVGYISTPPATRSGTHHHGSAESAIYLLRGRLRFFYGDRLENSFVAEAGDFIYVPPDVIHLEENLSDTEPVEFIVSRNSSDILVVNVPDPRG